MRKHFLLAALCALGLTAGAQQQDYAALLRRSTQHEKQAMDNDRLFRFLEQTKFEWGSETRAVIETRQGRVDRVIAFNNQPLTPVHQKREQERLNRFLRDPAVLKKEISKQHEEEKRRELMVASLADAFIVEFSGAETDGRLRFQFKPNPHFSPINRETQVFKGMQGWLWIDPVAERIAEIRGELFKDVNFGWGILGRLDKGGQFEVLQSQIQPGIWRITTLNLDFKGRLLLFKTLRIFHKENSSQFVPNPAGMDTRAALALLLENYSAGAQAQNTGQTGQN
jgi:hypothetical protein